MFSNSYGQKPVTLPLFFRFSYLFDFKSPSLPIPTRNGGSRILEHEVKRLLWNGASGQAAITAQIGVPDVKIIEPNTRLIEYSI